MAEDIIEKVCTVCGLRYIGTKEYLLNYFYAKKTNKFGLNASCKSCKLKIDRAYYHNNKIKCLSKSKERDLYVREHDPIYHKAYHMIIGARHRAKKKGLEFSIDYEWTVREFDKTGGKCPCCGIVMSLETNIGRRDNSASLDRFDNTIGYTKENTKIICFRCNEMKSDNSLEELKKLLIDMIKWINQVELGIK